MIDRQASFTNPSNRLICPTDGAGPLLRPVTSSAARGAADRLKYGMLEAKNEATHADSLNELATKLGHS